MSDGAWGSKYRAERLTMTFAILLLGPSLPTLCQVASSMSPLPPAGIILCGGKSSRMGRPKALLPFGPELMLERVVRILSAVVSPIVVVAAPEQDLPPLSDDVLL